LRFNGLLKFIINKRLIERTYRGIKGSY
jgi:hypothetical protein